MLINLLILNNFLMIPNNEVVLLLVKRILRHLKVNEETYEIHQIEPYHYIVIITLLKILINLIE